jgi:hypothetical protein
MPGKPIENNLSFRVVVASNFRDKPSAEAHLCGEEAFFPDWPITFMLKSLVVRPKAVKLMELVFAESAGCAELVRE